MNVAIHWAMRIVLVLTAAALLVAGAASGAIVAKDLLLTPLAPMAERNNLQLASTVPLDPQKPVWVSYDLYAISASDNPSGNIVLDAALEGIPTPIADSMIVFSADTLKRSSSDGTIGKQLEAKIGVKTPQELQEAFGPELYAAYKALEEKRGSILSGRIVKVYGAPGKPEARLLLSVDRATGMQPMMVSIVMGQGDVPGEDTPVASRALDKAYAAGIGAFLLAAFFWFMRRRKT